MFRGQEAIIFDIQTNDKKFLHIWTKQGMCALDYKRFYDKKLAKKMKVGSKIIVWLYRGGDVAAIQLHDKKDLIDIWYVGN